MAAESISTACLLDLTDEKTFHSKIEKKLARELLALRSLPAEMESAKEFVKRLWSVPAGEVTLLAALIGRDAQHARDRLALAAERDSAQEDVLRAQERIERLVGVSKENKRLREALLSLKKYTFAALRVSGRLAARKWKWPEDAKELNELGIAIRAALEPIK